MTRKVPLGSVSNASRRNLLRAGAWAIPAVTVAAAAPAFAVSPMDLGAFRLDGSCGGLPGVLGPGFTLTAALAELPVGTTVTVTGEGIANVGILSITGDATATVTVLSPTARSITLTSPLPPAATIAFRTALSLTVLFTLRAVVTLPPGYTATGAKTAGSVRSTLVLCSAE